jgi:hypothetical protein
VTKSKEYPHYAQVFEVGDGVIVYCAYCAVKRRNTMGGKAVLKAWSGPTVNMAKVYEFRVNHDEMYHRSWWDRH